MNKKKLLIIGSGPMLIEKGIVGTALGLRSWHILKPLMDSGDFEIDMFNIIFPEKYPEDHPIHKQHTSPAEIQNSFLDILPDLGPGLSITNINKDLGNTKKTLQRKLDSKNYNAIISINTHPSFIASKLKRTCPLWSDLNGWVMGEAQAQAGAWNDDSMLPKLWQMEQAIIQSADHFSTVSLPQKYALIGELASIGRLNSKTNNYEFAHVIENATDIQTFDTLQTKEADTSISENIQKIIESGNRYILSIGAYNTWVDGPTLLSGIEESMDTYPDIQFINTGKGIPGISEQGYQSFEEQCKKSRHADRIHLLGWVSRTELDLLLNQATLGINIDLPIYETVFGARNRMNEYLAFGLPVCTTPGSQIANTLIEHAGALQVHSQNAKHLASQLVGALNPEYPEQLRYIQKAGQEILRDQYSFEQTTQKLVKWAQDPAFAPDNGYKLNLQSRNKIREAISYLRKNGLKRLLSKIF